MASDVEDRALLSRGTSTTAVYRMIAETLTDRCPGGGTLIDVGCGRGDLQPFIKQQVDRYVGVDAVRYGEFPVEFEFHAIDLDTGRTPLPDGSGEIVVGAETIEHLENPRAFARELTRLAKPGGWVIITTPNQLSLLSKLGLWVKNEFPAFRGSNYPAHLTALLEIDLRRIAGECGWADVDVAYTRRGRLPGTARHWPRWCSRWFPRTLSDNVLVIGRKPVGTV